MIFATNSKKLKLSRAISKRRTYLSSRFFLSVPEGNLINYSSINSMDQSDALTLSNLPADIIRKFISLVGSEICGEMRLVSTYLT